MMTMPAGAPSLDEILVDTEAMPWREKSLKGVSEKMLWRNEETGATETVSKFGVRVPQQTFETVASDKRDDGIVQRNQFGIKKRGTLAVDYKMPFEGGIITQW